MTPNPRDLFGEVVITQDDIDLWLRFVVNIEPGTRKAAHYLAAWDVTAKVRAAKLSGRFDAWTSGEF